MKKTVLFFLMTLLVVVCNAQNSNFKLRSDGNFYLENGATFFVYQDSLSQVKLYNKVLANVTKLYVSPKDVISKIENDIISINGISENCVMLKSFMGLKTVFSIQYNLQFQFKDGKIRVEAPKITRFFTDDTPDIHPFSGWLKAQNVFKKGQPNPKKQSTIDDFNNTLNGLINKILNLNQSDNW
jgi:hypothetical protein